MALRKTAWAFLVLFLVSVVLATPVTLTVDAGNLLIKKGSSSTYIPILGSVIIESGDNLKIGNTPEVKCRIFDNVKLFLKDNTEMILGVKENKVAISLITGQLLLNKNESEEDIIVEIRAKNCIFTPVGTVAAFKFTKSGNPSVAVLNGSIRMTKPDGAAQDVGAGMYCTYNTTSNSFSPLKQLPPIAVASLESWANTDEPATEPEKQEETVYQSTSKPVATATPSQQQTQSTPQTQPQPSKPLANTQKTEPAQNNQVPPKKTKTSAPNSNTSSAQAPMPSSQGKDKKEETAKTDDSGKENDQETPDKNEKGDNEPTYEISTGMVTVDNEQWTRIAFSIDVPIWRFDVCFDLELFLDAQGNFSNKAWNFDSKKDAAKSLLRKIRYIRFNRFGDPLFIKLGGLDNITFGRGFIVDRFQNMLHYPGEKLLGLQFDLNDISPIGITLQTLIPDFMDFSNDGGILAGRLAFKPFKMTEKPLIGGMSIGGVIASDLNQYAPAKVWDLSIDGDRWDRDKDGITDAPYLQSMYSSQSWYSELVSYHDSIGDYDTVVEHNLEKYKRMTDKLIIMGADMNIPILTKKIIQLDLYAHVGATLNDENDDEFQKGWGVGAPGVYAKVGPIWAQVEFRHTEGRFSPGYFNTYYLDERLERNEKIAWTKEDLIPELNLNGVYGLLGCNIQDFLILSGSYQRLVGDDDALDQRAEMLGTIGNKILERIPKLNKVEAFFGQTNIDKNHRNEKDKQDRVFFQATTYTNWGYRFGVEVMPGASLIWQARYTYDENQKEEKNVTITAGLSF